MQTRDPNVKLQPGDLLSVDPSAVVTLQRPRGAAAPSPSSSSAAVETAADAADAPTDADAASSSSPDSPAPSSSPSPAPLAGNAPSTGPQPLPFHLPDYASPFLFVPAYLEPSFATCSAVYLRHPTARPGVSEVPSPYEADGEVMRLAWVRPLSLFVSLPLSLGKRVDADLLLVCAQEYYTAMGRKGDKRPAGMRGKRLGA